MKSLCLFFILISIFAKAQVGIGTTSPNITSILDISSSTNGILIPRLTSAQRNSIVSPAQSLLVYDNDVDLYYYFSVSNNSWTAINVGSIKNITTTSYTLTELDNGRVLDFNNALDIIVTVPASLPIGFQVSISQSGIGNVVLQPSGSMVINNRYNGTQTSGQWAKIGLEVNATNLSILSGDVK